MDRLRKAVRPRSASYEPLEGGTILADGSHPKPRFSRVEYCIFLLLGIAMLWAWNMFLAAAPYFQKRFEGSEWILAHFQSAILTVSTVTNLVSMILLTKLQRNASYPSRVFLSLVLNIICFTLLALSAAVFRSVSAEGYFAFLMVMVFMASLATGFCQNGSFAYSAAFGMGEYTQAIMTGQGIAGVLPCIVQIVTVVSVPAKEADDMAAQQSSKSAVAYFLTAAGVSTICLLAFGYLVKQHPEHGLVKLTRNVDEAEIEEQEERKVVGLWILFKKLFWLSTAVFIVFGLTMVYPVFTQMILSNNDPQSNPIFAPAVFIPLGFLFWNVGDLIGRLVPLIPRFNLVCFPKTVLFGSLARAGFIPLYLLCNIQGRGAVVPSDFFYLIVIQVLFGLTNGWLGSTCMMGASEWVEPEEREAAGGFMGLMLVGGLSVGSMLSFLAARG